MARSRAIREIDTRPPANGHFDFNFDFLGFDVDFCFSSSEMSGFIAVDGTVASSFTFTTNESSGFHVFLRDMLVSFVNEGFFNVLKIGLGIEIAKMDLRAGDGLLFLKPSPRMASRPCAVLAAVQPCIVFPPVPGLPEISGMTIPVVVSNDSLSGLSRMAEFLTPKRFLGMVADEHARGY